MTYRNSRQYGTSHQPNPNRYMSIGLFLLLNGCVTSQWDRQHQCQQTCDGKCSQSCAVVVEQGATEVKLPGH
jgi:hypothetical protein